MTFLSEHELTQKAAEWTQLLGVNPLADLVLLNPALIVVDMQKEFLSDDGLIPVWGGPAIVPNVNRLSHAFRAKGHPVFFTRMIYNNPEEDGGATARFWRMDRHSMILREGTWHAEPDERLSIAPGDIIITKRRYSAFFGTDLDVHLRCRSVREVIIAGVSSHICCEATAHDALFREYDVYFLADGTGGNDETAHCAVLRNIGAVYGRIVTTDQVIRAVS